MKPIVDKDTCIACGLCPSICPECFDMQDDGKAGAIVDEVPGEDRAVDVRRLDECDGYRCLVRARDRGSGAARGEREDEQ